MVCKDWKDPSPALQLWKSREGEFVTLLPHCPPCWELLSQTSQLPSAKELLDSSTSGPGGPKEIQVECHPLSAYSPCPHISPTVDPPPPERAYLSPCHSHCSKPVRTELWTLKKLRQQLILVLPSLNLCLSLSVAEASSSSRELPFCPLPSLLRTKLCSELA